MEPRGLAKIAAQSPGTLFDNAVSGIAKNLGVRGGASNPEAASMWINYLNDVLRHRARDLPAPRLQEMRTLATALGVGARGKSRQMLDILAQRFVALEARSTGQEALAPGMEIVEAEGDGLASLGHIRLASSALNRQAKLQANIDRLRPAGR